LLPIEWLIARLLFMTGTYTIDMISGHRRKGKIYDLIKVMVEDIVAPPQPFWELLLSFAVALIPIAIVVWDHQAATTVEAGT